MPKGKSNKYYGGEFKQKVIETMRIEKLRYRETARKFEVAGGNVIRRWERICLEEGHSTEHEPKG